MILSILFCNAASFFPHHNLAALPAHRVSEILQSGIRSQNGPLVIQNILRRDLIHCIDGRE